MAVLSQRINTSSIGQDDSVSAYPANYRWSYTKNTDGHANGFHHHYPPSSKILSADGTT